LSITIYTSKPEHGTAKSRYNISDNLEFAATNRESYNAGCIQALPEKS